MEKIIIGVMNEVIMCAPSINEQTYGAYLEALFLKRLLTSDKCEVADNEIKSACAMIRERLSNIKKGVSYMEDALNSLGDLQ